MRCLRCDSEMKQCKCIVDLGIYEPTNTSICHSSTEQVSRNPRVVYICENCGYMEFNAKRSEEDGA